MVGAGGGLVPAVYCYRRLCGLHAAHMWYLYFADNSEGAANFVPEIDLDISSQ